MKLHLSLSPAFLLALTVLAGCASNEPVQPPPEKPTYIAEERHTSTTEIVAVDPVTRTITLREQNQAPATYTVGKEVRNLDQVTPGDRVSVEYYESTSIKVLPPGAVVNEDTDTLTRSKPGEKPGGVAARNMTLTATIVSVFPETSEVVTRDAKGKLTTWKVRDAKKLQNVHTNDRVQLRYTESMAVRVTPAPPQSTPTPAPLMP